MMKNLITILCLCLFWIGCEENYKNLKFSKILKTMNCDSPPSGPYDDFEDWKNKKEEYLKFESEDFLCQGELGIKYVDNRLHYQILSSDCKSDLKCNDYYLEFIFRDKDGFKLLTLPHISKEGSKILSKEKFELIETVEPSFKRRFSL